MSHLDEHRPLNRATTFDFTTLDAASMPLTQQFTSRKTSHPSRKTSSRKTSRTCSCRKKSELMIVPSLDAVNDTAPNTQHFESIKTLFRWKESIYKLVWRHLVFYYVMYISLTIVYEFGLEETGKRHFEALTRYFSKSASTLNLMIMLGFFTSITLQRLFTMRTTVPGTAKTISSFIMSLKTDLPEGPIIVFQYARWAVLSWVLALRSVSRPLRDKYPDMISLQRIGILRPQERLILERFETDGDTTPRPLIVIDWMLLLLKESFKYGRYNNKSCHHKNFEILMAFKKSCGNMIKFATKNMPNAIIQAVIIAVYYFGLVTMLARDLATPLSKSSLPHQHDIPHQGDGFQESQHSVPKSQDSLRPDHDEIVRNIILYFPVMPLMQFFIFFAWLTFGRMAVNPFGGDDYDIDLESLLDSHVDDYKRLGLLYTQNLEDLFPDLPQKRFFKEPKDKDTPKYKDPAPIIPAPPKSPNLCKIASSSSPEFGSLIGATSSDFVHDTPLVHDRYTTAITIDDAIRKDFHNVPMG